MKNICMSVSKEGELCSCKDESRSPPKKSVMKQSEKEQQTYPTDFRDIAAHYRGEKGMNRR